MFAREVKSPLEQAQRRQKYLLLAAFFASIFFLYFPKRSSPLSYPSPSLSSPPFCIQNCSKKIFDDNILHPFFSLQAPRMECLLRPTYYPDGYDVIATYYDAICQSQKEQEAWSLCSSIIIFDSTKTEMQMIAPHFVYANGKEQIKGSAERGFIHLVDKKPVFEFEQPFFERTWA